MENQKPDPGQPTHLSTESGTRPAASTSMVPTPGKGDAAFAAFSVWTCH